MKRKEGKEKGRLRRRGINEEGSEVKGKKGGEEKRGEE
jgi:hypothetical protein